MSLMVNARHLFYGISMLEKYKGLGKIRGFLIYTLCDETFSIVSSTKLPEDVDRKPFYFFISLLNYLYWVAGSFLGGLVGNFITFDTRGLDFVLTGLFVVLFLEQWKNKQNRIPGIIGIGVTAFALIIFGKDSFILPAMAMILLTLIVGRKKICS
jgi:4-azaleucine resistance transporter AzlC